MGALQSVERFHIGSLVFDFEMSIFCRISARSTEIDVACVILETRMRSKIVQVKDLVEAEVTKDAVQVETFKGERVLQYMFPTTSMQARLHDFVTVQIGDDQEPSPHIRICRVVVQKIAMREHGELPTVRSEFALLQPCA